MRSVESVLRRVDSYRSRIRTGNYRPKQWEPEGGPGEGRGAKRERTSVPCFDREVPATPTNAGVRQGGRETDVVGLVLITADTGGSGGVSSRSRVHTGTLRISVASGVLT